MRTWGQRGEFPVFDRLVRESVMHLFGRLASVAEVCFKLESRSVTVFPLKRGLNTSRASVMWFVGIFPGVFCARSYRTEGNMERKLPFSLVKVMSIVYLRHSSRAPVTRSVYGIITGRALAGC